MQGRPPRKLRPRIGAGWVLHSHGPTEPKSSQEIQRPRSEPGPASCSEISCAQEDAAVQCLWGAALARVFEQVTRLRHTCSSLDPGTPCMCYPRHCSMISTITSATSVVAPMSRTSSRCSSSVWLPTRVEGGQRDGSGPIQRFLSIL